MPPVELAPQKRREGVFAIRTHDGKDLFAQAASVLECFGISGFALDDNDPAPFTGRDQFRIGFVHRKQCSIHQQTDVAQDQQSSD